MLAGQEATLGLPMQLGKLLAKGPLHGTECQIKAYVSLWGNMTGLQVQDKGD